MIWVKLHLLNYVFKDNIFNLLFEWSDDIILDDLRDSCLGGDHGCHSPVDPLLSLSLSWSDDCGMVQTDNSCSWGSTRHWLRLRWPIINRRTTGCFPHCSSAHQPRLCSTLSLYLETVVTCAAALLGGGGARIGSIRHPRTSHSHIQVFQTDADVRTKLLFNFLEMYLLTDNNLKI